MNKRLILTVGLPRAGKTTWAREQIKKGIPVIEADAVWIAKGYQEGMIPTVEDYQYVGDVLRTMVKTLFLSGHNTVVLVSNNVSRREREQWIDETGYWIRVFKIFETSYEICRERTLEAGLDNWIPALEKALSEIEPITEEEIRDGEGIIR